ncbi:hypothetical protein MNBD_GAMMA26-2316 [hydrothermal vent metagenome]|uniref:Uncharacterized protein n=1 Tax=hydrothermal vent metagenome TaxID=652676 RepID=A0A3B1BAZ6_9ZZZZ
MEQTDYKIELRRYYDNRNVDGIIRYLSELISKPSFVAINRRLIKEGKLPPATTKIEEVATALITELKDDIKQECDVIVQDNYFEIAEQLKKRFGDEVAEIYINTKSPDAFLREIRQTLNTEEAKLTEGLVNQYKTELIRLEDGRKAVLDILQDSSNFPIQNVISLAEQIEQLHLKLKSNYRYLTVKAYFLSIFESGDAKFTAQAASDQEQRIKISNYTLFTDYVTTGIEPDLIQQVRFRIEVVKLFQYLWKRKILPVAEHKQAITCITDIFNHRGKGSLSGKVRQFLEELIVEINDDKQAVSKRLAQSFVYEYRTAESQMEQRCGLIESELAATKEYLKQLPANHGKPDHARDEKAQLALEKIINLEGVFKIQSARAQTAANTPFHELERVAQGVSTVLSPQQITAWIRIYSILFSNTEFLIHTKETIDFSIMRKYISDLTTYHLMQSVSELKLVIDKSMATPSKDKPDHFKQFGEVLKIKIQGLMGGKKDEEKTFFEMIQELHFLDDSATQFVIAETFRGFQDIADAFRATVNDYFVRDRDTLLRESRELYNQICTQCLKNVIVRPARPTIPTDDAEDGSKGNKSWFSRLFS